MTITTQPFSQTICRRNKHSVRPRQETPERHLRNLQSDESNVCGFFSEPYVSLCPSKKKKKFESTFQSQSHVLKVAASLIWKEIFSYEAVNTSQSLLTGTLTCVLARPRVSSFFFFWILVHNQFQIHRVGRVCFWGGGVKMKSQLETERSSTCLLCLKLSGRKKL